MALEPQLPAPVEHDQAVDVAIRVTAFTAAVPAVMLIAYFAAWLYGGISGHPLPKPEPFVIEILTSATGTAMSALVTALLKKNEINRKS